MCLKVWKRTYHDKNADFKIDRIFETVRLFEGFHCFPGRLNEFFRSRSGKATPAELFEQLLLHVKTVVY